jgi:hypothetical protein
MPVLVGDETMFSFAAGEPLAISQHKIVLRREAQRRWAFLTPLDLSQRAAIDVNGEDRIGGQQAKVATIVHRWVAHHRFRGSPSQSTASLSAWESEGAPGNNTGAG